MKKIRSAKGFLWGRRFWEQGYFLRIVREQITDGSIRRYIEKHSFSQEELRCEGYYKNPALWLGSFTNLLGEYKSINRKSYRNKL